MSMIDECGTAEIALNKVRVIVAKSSLEAKMTRLTGVFMSPSSIVMFSVYNNKYLEAS